jgi:DNA-binding winged helix-turn-helix (wHTH) protein
MSARAQEMTMLSLMMERKISQLIHLSEKMERTPEKTPWQTVILFLSKAYIQMNSNRESAREMAEEALKRAENLGLERLAAIALGFSSFCDQHQQLNWLNLINQMDADNKAWFENFFQKAIGKNLMSGQVVITSFEKKLVLDSEEMALNADLTINESTGEVKFMGEKVELSAQAVLFKILLEIAKSQKSGLNKEELVKKVWGYEYNPLVHDSMIYTNIRRLRDLIPIELHLNQYRLASNIKWLCITEENHSEKMQALNERQKQIIKLLQTSYRQISRGDAVRLLHLSERTALRELTELVNKNILHKSGAGRSVKYSILEQGKAV